MKKLFSKTKLIFVVLLWLPLTMNCNGELADLLGIPDADSIADDYTSTCNYNGYCDSGENETNCYSDCYVAATCNYDAICNSGEDSTNCPSDCGSSSSTVPTLTYLSCYAIQGPTWNGTNYYYDAFNGDNIYCYMETDVAMGYVYVGLYDTYNGYDTYMGFNDVSPSASYAGLYIDFDNSSVTTGYVYPNITVYNADYTASKTYGFDNWDYSYYAIDGSGTYEYNVTIPWF